MSASGKLIALQHHRPILRRECVVGVRVLQLRDDTDVARVQPGHLEALLALRDGQVRELFRLLLRRRSTLPGRSHRAAEDAEVAELADVRLASRS